MEIKFINKKNKILIILILILICVSVFLVTYFITYKLNAKNRNANFVNRNKYETAMKNEIRELVIVNQNSFGEFSEKNRIKLEIADINKFFEEMYLNSSYEILDFNDKSIILRELSIKVFEPNMYYIGEKDGYVTVFKSNEEGKLFVENESIDISNKKVDFLPLADREMVRNYELKSDNREGVQYILSELET